MDFCGTAQKLSAVDIPVISHELDIDPYVLRAVIEVETSGSGFDSKGRPKALFERHFFYRHLLNSPEKLQIAVAAGLAYPKWGEKPYPKGSDGVYAEIMQAVEIDTEAALCSVSWGMGQVMGDNYRVAGCLTVFEMVEQAKQSEINQLRHMANFIKANGLVDELQRKDWAGFAKHYNGPAYIKNQYDVKLAAAYERFTA
jgi:hypothetical protein